MWIFLFASRFVIHRDNLTDTGRKIFGENGTRLYGKREMGVVFVGDQKPQIWNFEGMVSWKGMAFHYAPTMTTSAAVVSAIFGDKFDLPGQIASFDIDFGKETGVMRLDVETKTKMYRSLRGNVAGTSYTVVETEETEFVVFEPLPDFCKLEWNSVVKRVPGGVEIPPGTGSYGYRYKCRFLHWSEFPANPERGFVLGPVIMRTQNGEFFFFKSENLVLPTPDFSMVYNMPMILGLMFSLTAAMLIRLIMRKSRKPVISKVDDDDWD